MIGLDDISSALVEIETQLRNIVQELERSDRVHKEFNQQLGQIVLAQQIRALTEMTFRVVPSDPQSQKLQELCTAHLVAAVEKLHVELITDNAFSYRGAHLNLIKTIHAELASLRGFGERSSPAEKEKR